MEYSTALQGLAGYRPTASVSAVIPTLNEAKNVKWVLDRMPDCIDEIIIVDGRSTDDTVAIAREARPEARIVLERTPGKGSAVRAGFAEARGDLIVMLDADGSMDPSEICRHLMPLEDGYDLVKGSRFLRSGGTTDISRIRALGNLGLVALVNGLYGSRFTELCYGFMAFRREVLPKLHLTASGFEIETQIVVHALRARVRIAEVPSFESERRFGESNLRTIRDGVRALRTLLAGRGKIWPAPGGRPAPDGLAAGQLADEALAQAGRVAVGSSAAQPSESVLST
jgi:glycosyltransferase involved in cell wall biosynthesis